MSDHSNLAPRHQYQDFLPQLPPDWEQKEIRQIGTVVSGGTPSREVSSYWKGNIPWVTPGEISGRAEKLLFDTKERISTAGLSGSGANLLPANSLMVTTRATLGARAINAVPMTTNQGFKSIIFKSSGEESYYFHLFEKIKPELVRRASGTTFLEISGAEFGSIKVPDPLLPEKQLIAKIIDTLDTAIHATDAVIYKLKAVKRGMLHDLLTRGIDANGELRPHQCVAPQLYKASPLGWIPNEWHAKELAQLTDPNRPVVYGILMPGYGYPGGVPVVKVKDIVNEKIHLNDLLLTSPQIDSEYSRSRLKKGDLLFTIRGTVGRTAFVPAELDSANITQDTARLAVTGTDARFLRAYLSTSTPSRFIATHTLGVAVQGINLRDVRRIPIALPPRFEAEAIADEVESLEERLESEALYVAKLRLAKSALTSDLLTGHIRVTALLEGAAP